MEAIQQKQGSTSFFSSIRIKIILLPIIGILGMLAIAGMNKFLNISITEKSEAGQVSQELAERFIEQMMVEEKFINTIDISQIKIREKQIHSLDQASDRLKNFIDPGLVQDIVQKKTKHDQVFSTIANLLESSRKYEQELTKAIGQINSLLDETVHAIDQEEIEKMLEGEVLSSMKVSARKETVCYSSLGNRRLLNIFQNLIVLKDEENYLKSKAEMEKVIEKAGKNVEIVYKALNDTNFMRRWEKVQEHVRQINEIEANLFEAWRKNQALMPRFHHTANDARKAVINIVDQTRTEIESKRKVSDINSLYVALVSMAVLSFLGIMVYRSVSIPIAKTVDMLKDIAEGEGDLTKRLESGSRDEIGQMAEWFNRFIEKIQVIVRDMAGNAEKLGSSADTLTGISRDMSQGAAQTSGKASGAAASSEAMSTSFNSVAASMEETSTNMNMINSATDQMSATIQEIAENTEKASSVTFNAVNQADTASSQMKKLGTSAQEIGKVIETITDIGEQVNLLALNATIEAARAGEAGKGFAVVANEIKDLAYQTTQASAEIEKKIQDIQVTTEDTVKEMANITSVVNKINEIVSTISAAVEEQTATTREISGSVSQASAGIGQVNENMAHSSQTAGNIANEISEVTKAAEEISENSARVDTSAAELLSLAEALNTVVGKFKY